MASSPYGPLPAFEPRIRLLQHVPGDPERPRPELHRDAVAGLERVISRAAYRNAAALRHRSPQAEFDVVVPWAAAVRSPLAHGHKNATGKALLSAFRAA